MPGAEARTDCLSGSSRHQVPAVLVRSRPRGGRRQRMSLGLLFVGFEEIILQEGVMQSVDMWKGIYAG